MNGHFNLLTGWRRCLGLSLVGLMTLMLWLAADASAHRSLHALCDSVGEHHDGSDSEAGSGSNPGGEEDHCAITLFQQGRVEALAVLLTWVPIDPIPDCLAPSCADPGPTSHGSVRLPFSCGPPQV